MSDQAFPDALPAQYRMHWYTLERVLGQGGFGITYLARDTNLDQRVAIKEYLPVEVAARRADGAVQSRGDAQRERYRWGLERFIQEARTLARFDHPNIVRVHSVFEFNGTAYMVMRFEEGDNLAAMLERRGTLPEKDLLRILLPILDGLELVHNAGFIHRDIKPDNIHIRADGSPVLLDFGSARHALGKAHTLTILVAPGYAPFEQYHSSSENQGPWTDIYGLGATCYRAIAGTAPLDAISRSKGILGSTREMLVPAATVGSGRYSGRLLAAVDHALAFDEKARPQTVAEWRMELRGEAGAAGALPPRAEKAPSFPPEKVSPLRVLPDTTPSGQNAVTHSAWSIAPIAWAVAGAAAGAIAIAVFIRMTAADGDAEKKLAAATQKIEHERESLEAQRRRLEEKRLQEDAERKSLDERRQQEEAKRRQDEQARLEEQKKQEEAKRMKEQQARLAEQQKRAAAEAQRPKDRPRGEAVAARAPKSPGTAEKALPAVVSPPAVESERESSAIVASVKLESPKPSPQAEQLARGESALARGDYAVALESFRPLAEAGNTRAQIRLAEMYIAGQGVKRNNNQAYIWYSLAARSGNAAAAAERSRIALLLQPAEIKQADRLVESMRVR